MAEMKGEYMIILIGDSASGKSTVEKVLNEKYGMKKVISYTTRPPKDNEVNGIDYNFISMNDFLEMDDEQVFVEIGAYRGNFYGSTKVQYDENTVATLTPHGLRKLRKKLNMPFFSVYIKVPRKDRLIKMLTRKPNKDDVEECIIKNQYDVGMYNGVSDEVDFVIENPGYKLTPDEIAEIIYNKSKENIHYD